MLGELLLAVVGGAMSMDDNETTVTTSNNETIRAHNRAAADVEIEKQRTKQAKEETRRVIIEGVFNFLNECAQDSNDTTR